MLTSVAMKSPGEKSSRLHEFVADPRRGLWVLSVPMMVGMSVQTAYTIVDMIYIGRVGPEALAALAFNVPPIFFVIGLVFGLGSGVTAIVAQHIGAGDKRKADCSAEHAVALGAVLSLVASVLSLLWGRRLLAVLGVPAEIMDLTWAYFWVIASAFIFMVMSVFFRSILSGEGDMKTPMLIQVAGTVLNIVLDPIFIFGFDMGIQGAALATVASQVLVAGAYVFLLFFKKHSYVTFELAHFKFSGSILAGIFRIGLPASGAFLVMSLGVAIFNKILSTFFSSDAVAAFQVGNRLDHIFMLPTLSVASALVTLVGMFHGAQRHDLMRRIIAYAIGRTMVIAAVVGTVFFLFAPQLIAIFSEDPEIRTMGTTYLRISVFAYPFIVVAMMSGRSLQGVGRGVPLLVLTTLRMFLISAPLALFFVHVMGKPLEWVWASMVFGMICTSTIGFFWMQWGLRRAVPAASAGLVHQEPAG